MNIATRSIVGPVATRIRTEFGGQTVADSTRARLYRRSPFKVYYLFPEEDVKSELLDKNDSGSTATKNGEIVRWTLRVDGREAKHAAFTFREGAQAAEGEKVDLSAYIGFDFDAMDSWYEEAEKLLGHPRDPFTRIDIRRGSRPIRAEVDGVTIVDSAGPLLLTETGLGLRYYIPKDDVNWKLFSESDTESICPYKGRARYWSANIDGKQHKDLIWAYPDPLQDAERIRDTVGLYHEKMTIYLDGEKVDETPTHFTK